MTVDVPQLAVGIALLWFPRHWMRRGVALLKRRRKSKESERIMEPWKDREPGDPRVTFKVEFTKARNYVDLFRALAGGLAIWGGLGLASAVVAEGAANDRFSAYAQLGARCAVLLLGVLVQAVRFEKNRVSFYPPIFYLAGLSLALCGYQAAIFAFIMVWTVNVGLPNAQMFLFAYAALIVAFGGFLIGPTSIPVMFAGFLMFLPVLLSLLANRPLMIFTRKGSRSPKSA